MEVFKYEALPSEDHIRIIELFPGSTDDVIRCNLTVELRHQTQKTYDAISYVWGDEKIVEEIICCERSKLITVNLAGALRKIREKNPGRSTRLWADAISINQDDTAEKNHQVKRMGLVYENCAAVHIWLGPDVKGIAKDLFEVIQGWTRCLNEYKEPSTVSRKITQSDLCKDPERGSKLAELMKQDWFSRVWVVQEVALAEIHHLHWGDETLDFSYLIELACFSDGSPNAIHLMGGDNANLRFLKLLFCYVYRSYGKTQSWGGSKRYHFKGIFRNYVLYTGLFLDILALGRLLHATKPQDHIFAFLGNPLALDSEGNMIIEPDYGKTEAQINCELAEAFLRSSRESPYVLCFVEHLSPEEITGSKGPSWVPRWRNNVTERNIVYTIGNIGLGFEAGGRANSLRYQIRDSQILTIQGLIVDQLCWTSEVLKKDNFSLDTVRRADSLGTSLHPYVELLWAQVSLAYKRCLEPVQSLDPGRYEDDFGYTLVTGYNNSRVMSLKDHRDVFRAYRQVLEKRLNGKAASEEYVISKTKDERASKFAKQTRNCNQRRFAITESGRFALVPEFARAGDVCALFLGMATPFVLRPAKEQVHGEGYHHLVGETYMHGFMRGELRHELNKGSTGIMLI